MPEGQYQFIITPRVEDCQELANPKHRSHSIVFDIEFIFGGYHFHDRVTDIDLAFQMKTDMEKRFKTLRDAE